MKLKKDRLEIAIIFSVFLHFVLIGLLLIGSFFTKVIQYSAGGSGGDQDSFEAVMVDTGQVAEEYNRLVSPVTEAVSEKVDVVEKTETEERLTPETVEIEKEVVEVDNSEALKIAEQERQQKLEQQKAEQERIQKEKQRQQEIAKQQEETRKKLAEQARLKAEAEAKRLEALAKQAEEERKAKAEQEAKAKAEKEAKAKAEQEAKAKAEIEAKAKAEQEAKAEKEAKAKAEQEAKAKAEKEAKAKAEQAAKAKAEKEAKAKAEQVAKAKAEKEAKAREATRAQQLLDGTLGQGSNRNQSGSTGSGGATGVGRGSAQGNRYLDQISRLLKSNFKNASGQSCYVRIFIERNGVIRNYQVTRGPADVCEAATRAVVATGKVPPAPSDAIYQQYNSPTIEFRP